MLRLLAAAFFASAATLVLGVGLLFAAGYRITPAAAGHGPGPGHGHTAAAEAGGGHTAAATVQIAADGARVVEAERFVLRDRAGRARAVLSCDEDSGQVAFLLQDAAEAARGILALSADGAPTLLLADANGTGRIGMRVGADDAPVLMLTDANGQARMLLGTLDAAERFGLSLRDATGEDRLHILQGDEAGELVLSHPNGRELLRLTR